VFELKCRISGKRVCKPIIQDDSVFIIGSGDKEFAEDTSVVIALFFSYLLAFEEDFVFQLRAKYFSS
jgi:hypothetical protein